MIGITIIQPELGCMELCSTHSHDHMHSSSKSNNGYVSSSSNNSCVSSSSSNTSCVNNNSGTSSLSNTLIRIVELLMQEKLLVVVRIAGQL